MRFIGSVIKKLQRHPKRIVFPEGTEPRILQAARKLKAGFNPRRPALAARKLPALRQAFEVVYATDYFPGPAAAQTGQLLAEMDTLLNARD